jgi:hypothetical protein
VFPNKKYYLYFYKIRKLILIIAADLIEVEFLWSQVSQVAWVEPKLTLILFIFCNILICNFIKVYYDKMRTKKSLTKSP